MRENDVIKLGRVKFRVRELHVSEEIEGQQNDSGIDEISELVFMGGASWIGIKLSSARAVCWAAQSY